MMGSNKDGENPYPSTANVGWNAIWNGDATATPSYSAEQTIPFAFSFNGAAVTKYTPSNFGTISFDAWSHLANLICFKYYFVQFSEKTLFKV